jgi:hypothetical protein
MQLLTLDQLYAFGRHVPSYLAGAVTMAVGFNVVTPEQGHQVSEAFAAIGNGLISVAGGVATLISIGSGIYAAYTASPGAQIKSVAAMPDVEHIVSVPHPDPTGAVAAAVADHDQPKVSSAVVEPRSSVPGVSR